MERNKSVKTGNESPPLAQKITLTINRLDEDENPPSRLTVVSQLEMSRKSLDSEGAAIERLNTNLSPEKVQATMTKQNSIKGEINRRLTSASINSNAGVGKGSGATMRLVKEAYALATENQ